MKKILSIAMTMVMMSYLENVSMVRQKFQVGQIARKYILQMETEGYLSAGGKNRLCQELENMGVTEVNLEDTTLHEVSYGAPITLRIRGKLKGEYVFDEKKVSTAKH